MNTEQEDVFVRLNEALTELRRVLPQAPLAVQQAIANVFAALAAKDDFVMEMTDSAVRLLFIASHPGREVSNQDQVH